MQQKCIISLYQIIQSWQFFHHHKAPCSYSLELYKLSPKDPLLEQPVQLVHSKMLGIIQQKCVISLHQIIQSWQFFHYNEVPCTYSPELQWLPTKNVLLTWSVQLTNSKTSGMGLHNKNVSYLHTESFNSDNFFTTTKLHAHTIWNCDKLSPKNPLLE